MPSELNHHVGYSRENECWFVRFYPYQTEQQAIEAIAEFTRPTPVAPISQDATGKCGELVTVAWRFRHSEQEKWYYGDSPQNWWEKKELCDRSQAEELLAAERAEKEIAERNRDTARENFLTMHKSAAKLLKRAEKAEADNAAKEARIARDDDVFQKLIHLGEEADAKFEALEAKLAAAEKALEGLREKGRKVLDVLKAWEDDGDLVNSGKIVSDFRAVLGGKPSC